MNSFEGVTVNEDVETLLILMVIGGTAVFSYMK